MNTLSARLFACVALVVFGITSAGNVFAELPQLTPTQQVAPTATEVATDPDDEIEFGLWVTIDRDTAMVSMPDYGPPNRIAVYRRMASGHWTRAGSIEPGPNDGFGPVMLKDGTAFVQGSGGIYVFREVHGVWVKTATLSPPTSARPIAFGSANGVRYDNGIAAVGATYTDDYTGTIFLFLLNRSGQVAGWSQVFPSDAETVHLVDLDLQDDTLVVTGNTPTDRAVFVLHRFGSQWVQTQKITRLDANADPSSVTQFGYPVVLNHGLLFIGDQYARSFAGEAYVFAKTNGQFSYRAFLHPSADQLANYSAFGSSIVSDGNRVVISTLEPPSYLSPNGVAVVYEIQGDEVVPTHIARFDESYAMSLSGNQLLLGSPYFVDYDDYSFHTIGWADFYTLPPAGR